MTISRPFFQCYNQCIFSGGKGAGTLHSGVANHPQVLVSRWKKVVGLSTNEYTQKKALVITMYILLLCVCVLICTYQWRSMISIYQWKICKEMERLDKFACIVPCTKSENEKSNNPTTLFPLWKQVLVKSEGQNFCNSA